MKNPFPMKPNWQYLMYAYVLFAASFFFPVWHKYHNHYYYFAILTPFILSISRDRLRGLMQSSIFRLVVIYIGMIAVSVLWASPPEPHKLYKYLLDFIYLTAFIALTIELTLRIPSFPDTIIKAVLVSAVVLIPISVYSFYHDHPLAERLEGIGRLQNPIAGATMYGLVALLCLHVAIQKDRFPTLWRVFAMICGAFCLAYIALAQSRSPALGLIIAGTLYVALQGNWRLFLAILGASLAIGLAFYLDILPLDPVISRGLSYRPEIWMQTIPTIMKNPWFGNGATFDQVYHLTSHPDIYSHTHSALMASLVFVGIVGTGILLLLIVQSIRYAYQTAYHLTASLLVYAIINLVISGYKVVDNPQIEWLYFWFPVALVAASEIKFRNPSPS